MLNLIWLIPLFPLVGVTINGLFGRRMPRKAVGVLACAMVLASLVIAVGAVWELAGLPDVSDRIAEPEEELEQQKAGNEGEVP